MQKIITEPDTPTFVVSFDQLVEKGTKVIRMNSGSLMMSWRESLQLRLKMMVGQTAPAEAFILAMVESVMQAPSPYVESHCKFCKASELEI